ncbi:MAG: hypothetical protein ACYDEJ_02095 [Desulfitobacteriaceae bacterium]
MIYTPKDICSNNLIERIIRLEESSEQFKDDIVDLKTDIKEVKSELCTWFNRLDDSVQGLNIAQTRLSEQLLARKELEIEIKNELYQSTKLKWRIFIALTTTSLSALAFILKELFLQKY